MNRGDWEEWQMHVLKELDRFDKELQVIHKDNRQILVAIATLKSQAAFWGSTAGVMITVALHFLLK